MARKPVALTAKPVTSEDFDRLQRAVNDDALQLYGHALTVRAIKVLDRVFQKKPMNWTKAYYALSSQAGKSRSNRIALEMFEDLIHRIDDQQMQLGWKHGTHGH